MQLQNEFYTLEFNYGIWTGFYDRRSGSGNFIVSPVEQPAMLRIKKNITEDTVTNFGPRGVQSGCYDVTSGAFWLTDNDPWTFVSEEIKDGKAILSYHNSCFKLKVIYSLCDLPPRVERSFELEYTGEEKIYLHEVILSTPGMCPGGDAQNIEAEIYDTRNHLGGLRHPLGKMQLLEGDRFPDRNHSMTAMDKDFHHEVTALMYNKFSHTAIGFWGGSDQQEAVAYVAEENEQGLKFDQTFFCFADLSKTPKVSCSRQIISVYQAPSWREAVDGIIELKATAGFVTDKFSPQLRAGPIYQVHTAISDIGGFAGMRKNLKILKELGVQVLYLPPLAGPESYLNFYPDQVMSSLGTEDDLKLIVDEAHNAGMKVIVDMIAHDVFCDGPPSKVEGFIRKDELGNPLTYAIGTVLTETCNQGYIDYYINCCRNLCEKFGIDGFRFDVASFQLPGWGAVAGAENYRPGRGVCAQSGLLQKLHDELGPDLIILEEGLGSTGFRYITHGWIQCIKRLRDKSRRKTEPLGVLLERIKLMLSGRRVKERKNVETMLHTKIHDTALPQQFGSAINDIDLALTILCFTSDCVPLITQGMERGYFEMLRTLVHIRKTCPEFTKSNMDFENYKVDNDSILVFGRNSGQGNSIVAINFSDHEVVCKISGRRVLSRPVFVYNAEVIDNADVECFKLKLSAYGAVIMRDESVKHLSELTGNCGIKNEVTTIQTFSEKLPIIVKDCPDAELNLHFVYNLLPVGGIGKVILSATPDEGSIDGKVVDSNSDCLYDKPLGSDWHNNIGGFEHWPESFVPSTRLPFKCVDGLKDCNYIEDVFASEDEFSAGRDPRSSSGKCFFRKVFSCEREIRKAVMQVSSPGSYRCSLAIKNGGVSRQMLDACNPCKCYINGFEFFVSGECPARPLDITDQLVKGKNLLAVTTERANATRGIIAKILIEYADGTSEIIGSDSSWKCFPGTIWRTEVRPHPRGFAFSLIPLENTLQARGKVLSGLLLTDDADSIRLIMDQGDERLIPVWQIKTKADKWFAEDSKISLQEPAGLWGNVRDTISGSPVPVWQNRMFKMDSADFGFVGANGKKLVVNSADSKNSIYCFGSSSVIEIVGSMKVNVRHTSLRDKSVEEATSMLSVS